MKKPNRIHSKRHFQLLEVMIGFFLIAVCLTPMMSSYVYLYKEQKNLNRMIELDHLSHRAHARIIEDLYFRGSKGEPLNDIPDKKYLLSNLDPKILKNSPYDFTYEFRMLRPKSEKKRSEATKFLLNLQITVINKDSSLHNPVREYNYTTYVVRGNKAPAAPVGEQEQKG